MQTYFTDLCSLRSVLAAGEKRNVQYAAFFFCSKSFCTLIRAFPCLPRSCQAQYVVQTLTIML